MVQEELLTSRTKLLKVEILLKKKKFMQILKMKKKLALLFQEKLLKFL